MLVDQDTYDVAIIGAGISGSTIARELSRYKLSVALLEKGEDVAIGSTKANSGIVHGGYADKPSSLHAKFCVAGNKMYRKLNEELNFGFSQLGSLVVAFNQEEAATLKKLYEQGVQNGVEKLEIVGVDFLQAREPHLSKDIVAALYCPSAGVTSPYEFAIALTENAITNGVKLFLNSSILSIKKQRDFFSVTTSQGDLHAKYIINAAGLYADTIAKMVGDESFSIHPRQGQYLLFDKEQGSLVKSVIFQTPTKMGKGVLVTRSYHGNLMIGPDATDLDDKEDLATSRDHIQEIVQKAKKSMPDFDLRKAITSFAGNRAIPSTGKDFIIGESSVKGFINVAGIASPGLTSAPAIAKHVVELLANSDLNLQDKKNFNPYRNPYNVISEMEEDEIEKLIKEQPEYGRVICRCETVSEGEILDALRRNIPVKSLDALKRRVRAGMGRCQGGFCTPRLLAIMQRELNIPITKITKKGEGSEVVKGEL